ncbi:MAG: hypothetical protein F4X82_01785 [Candidatus Spechtbacteria bacterium SB0662_bin_43]|uniref:Large polyvalent protein associated domain-containing protein n=1 Tax=Candidatus Spechtbacteria bacterium SB0662_bin_43 TaxID=2604897 RepID=A0A845DLN3_9BACT|nr:hypothetical protein [Candidatus Spechtbacteria bacterium SB0662_bin_43]
MAGLARDTTRTFVENNVLNTPSNVIEQAQEQQSRGATVRQGQLEMTARRLRSRLTDAYGVSEDTTFLEHRLTTFGSPIITNIPSTAEILETLRDVEGGVTGANDRLLRLITPVERHVVQQPEQVTQEQPDGLLDVGGAVQAGAASGVGSQLVQGTSSGDLISPSEIIQRQGREEEGGIRLSTFYGNAARAATSAFLSANNTLTEAAADITETLGLGQNWADLLRSAQIDEITADTDITNSILGTDFVDNILKDELLDLYDPERTGVYPLGKSTYIRGSGAVAGEILIGGLEAYDAVGIYQLGGYLSRSGLTQLVRQQTSLLPTVDAIGDINKMTLRDNLYKEMATSTDTSIIKRILTENGGGIILDSYRLDDLARKISGMSNSDEIGNFINKAIVDRVKHLSPQQLDRNLQYVYNIDKAVQEGVFSGHTSQVQNTARAIAKSRLSQEALRQAKIPNSLRSMVNAIGTRFSSRADFQSYIQKNGADMYINLFRDDLLLNNSRHLYQHLAVVTKELERQQVSAKLTRLLFKKSRQTRRSVEGFLRLATESADSARQSVIVPPVGRSRTIERNARRNIRRIEEEIEAERRIVYNRESISIERNEAIDRIRELVRTQRAHSDIIDNTIRQRGEPGALQRSIREVTEESKTLRDRLFELDDELTRLNPLDPEYSALLHFNRLAREGIPGRIRTLEQELDNLLELQREVELANLTPQKLGQRFENHFRRFSKDLDMTREEVTEMSSYIREYGQKTREINNLRNTENTQDTTVLNAFNREINNLGNTPEQQLESIYDMVEEVGNIQSNLPVDSTVGRNFFLRGNRAEDIASVLGTRIQKALTDARLSVTEATQNRLIGEARSVYEAMTDLGIPVLPDDLNPYIHHQVLRSILAAETEKVKVAVDDFVADEVSLFNNYNAGRDRVSRISFEEFQQDLNSYLQARRAPSYNRSTNTKRGAGLTDGEAEIRIGELNEKYGENYFENFATKLYEFNRETLTFLRDYGLLRDDEFLNISTATDHYVPLRREIERDRNFATELFNASDDILRRAKGSDRRVVDVVGASINARNVAIARKEVNEVGVRLDNLLSAREGLLADKIQIVKRDVLDREFNRSYKNKEGYYSYLRDGNRVVFKVTDPFLERALGQVPRADVENVILLATHAARIMAVNYTTRNPAFFLANITKDLITMMVNISAIHGKKAALQSLVYYPFSAVGLALPSTARNIPYAGKLQSRAELFRSVGGEIGGVIHDLRRQSQDIISGQFDDVLRSRQPGSRALARRGTKGVVNSLYVMSGYLENVARFTAFQVALSQGATIEQARQAGLEATVNFLTRGSGISGRRIQIPRSTKPVLNAIPPVDITIPYSIRGLSGTHAFLNAGVQSNQRLLLTAGTTTGLVAYIALGYGGATLEHELNDDVAPGWDDDLRRAKPFEYKRYVNIIRDEDRNRLKFPITHEGAIFLEIGRMIKDLEVGKSSDAQFIERLSKLPRFSYDSVNPLSEGDFLSKISPTALKPIFQNLSNIAWHNGFISPKDFSRTGIPEDNLFRIQKANNETEWELGKEVADIYNEVFGYDAWPLLNTAGKAKTFTDAYLGGFGDTLFTGVDMVRQALGEEIIRSDRPIEGSAFFNFLFKSFHGDAPAEEAIQRSILEELYNRDIVSVMRDYYSAKNDGNIDGMATAMDELIDYRTSGVIQAEEDFEFIRENLVRAQGFRDLTGLFRNDIYTIRPPRPEYNDDGTIASVPTFQEWYIYLRLSGEIVDKEEAQRIATQYTQEGLIEMNETNRNGYEAPVLN